MDKQLTWYLDPPGATAPGIYVAFDYGCVYPKLKHCSGVLIFHQAESGDFKVIREETRIIDKKTFNSLSDVPLSIKPHEKANISTQQWQAYYQLATIKYYDNVTNTEDNCTTQVGAEDIYANIYFTQPCHPAHPAWVTLSFEIKNDAISINQIGYFAGRESAFADMFNTYKDYKAFLLQKMKQQD